MTMHDKLVKSMMLVAIIILLVKNSVALDDTVYEGLIINNTLYDSYDDYLSDENETDYFSNQVTVDLSDHVFAVYEEGNEKWSILREVKDWKENSSIIAQAKFENDQQQSGWMFLNIESKGEASDELQAYAAGLLEGYVTGIYIIENYREFYTNDVCKTHPDVCEWVKGRIQENNDWIEEQIGYYSYSDPYWHQVFLIYRQLDGIKEGCRLKSYITPDIEDGQMDYEMGVLLLNLAADFWDMKAQYDVLYPNGRDSGIEKRSTKLNQSNRLRPKRPSCSVLIKYLETEDDIILAHNTWHEYRAMSYRLLKNYKLNYHVLPESSDLVPGYQISMSSYAGVALSLDDFYLISSGLAATETSLFVYDQELYRNLSTFNVIFEPFRVMIANRLSNNGSDWENTFGKYNSGTYNNQWMIVDYKLLDSSRALTGEQVNQGLLTVLEQLPGHIVVDDKTNELKDKSYWASYNRAYYNEVFERSGASKMVEEYGDWFTHDKTSRAKIFEREENKVKDLDSMMRLMRYNDFKNEPFAEVEGCDEARVPAGSIANRLDLSDANSTCKFSDTDYMIGALSGYGALDAKVASKDSFPNLEFTAVAGPTHDNFPPFKWSETEVTPVPEFKPIDEFNFEPIKFTWAFEDSTVTSEFMVLKHVDMFEQDTEHAIRDSKYESDQNFLEEVPLSDSTSMKTSTTNTDPTDSKVGGPTSKSSLKSGTSKSFDFLLPSSLLIGLFLSFL